MVGGVRQPTSQRRKERPPGVGMAGARGAEDLQQPSIFSWFDFRLAVVVVVKQALLSPCSGPSKQDKHSETQHNTRSMETQEYLAQSSRLSNYGR